MFLLDDMAFHLQPPGTSRYNRPSGTMKVAYDDMVRLAASLERVPVERKIEVGQWLLHALKKPSENLQSWWAVGRIGARAAVLRQRARRRAARYRGRLDRCDPRARLEEGRAGRVRRRADRQDDRRPFARPALRPSRRSRAAARTAANASRSWIEMVNEAVELNQADEGRVFGESLPAG